MEKVEKIEANRAARRSMAKDAKYFKQQDRLAFRDAYPAAFEPYVNKDRKRGKKKLRAKG